MQNFFGLRGTADFDPFFSRLGRGFEWPIPKYACLIGKTGLCWLHRACLLCIMSQWWTVMAVMGSTWFHVGLGMPKLQS